MPCSLELLLTSEETESLQSRSPMADVSWNSTIGSIGKIEPPKFMLKSPCSALKSPRFNGERPPFSAHGRAESKADAARAWTIAGTGTWDQFEAGGLLQQTVPLTCESTEASISRGSNCQAWSRILSQSSQIFGFRSLPVSRLDLSCSQEGPTLLIVDHSGRLALKYHPEAEK